jgi:hypothetical protein
VLIVAAIGLAVAGRAEAGSRDILYGKVPDWVLSAPVPTANTTPAGGTVQVIYTDTQVRLGADSDDTFTAYRVKILSPAALALGKVTAAWNPSTDDLTVHKLTIYRDGQAIDVLSSTKFQILQREDNLDASMLDGQLTAVLQVPDVQVGDELEFAASLHHHDPVLTGASHGVLQLPATALPGAYRIRLLWPDSKKVAWRAIDLNGASPTEAGRQRDMTVTLVNPKAVLTPDGAPPRYSVHRILQYSSFSSWADVAHAFAPLFERAAQLAADSPVRAEAKKIASQTNDPNARVQAALKLVQERVRYVYVGLNGANYQPATADETWRRRFGDCKAKTVLLIALLRELGVQAEAVLVNSKQDDAAGDLLPTPDVFDHVLVRATIGTKSYWLDGTRLGQYFLSNLPPAPSRFVLPLRDGAVGLEEVPREAPTHPQLITVIDVDAGAGLTKPAQFKVSDIIRGDEAVVIRTQLSSLAPDDAERAEKAFWRQQMSWVEAGKVAWRYDEEQNMVVLTMSGDGKLDWDGDDAYGHGLDIYHAGQTPPNEMQRPKEQDQSAPWVTEFPSYKCWVTTIRLPPARPGWRWDYAAKPINLELGGVRYWRIADMRSGVVRTVMSRQTLLPEITAAQAKEVNDRLPSFDNKISRVFEEDSATEPSKHDTGGLPPPPGDGVDWSSPSAPCGPTS